MCAPVSLISNPSAIEGSMICPTLNETEDIYSVWNDNTLHAHLKYHENVNIKY